MPTVLVHEKALLFKIYAFFESPLSLVANEEFGFASLKGKPSEMISFQILVDQIYRPFQKRFYLLHQKR